MRALLVTLVIVLAFVLTLWLGLQVRPKPFIPLAFEPLS